ncbi:MAG: GNAT family N-acetyltransferase [Planctomycetes bacterium]|nr:GNAT family N-acetyltransferase [Planctomycetota bacterium]
MITVRHAMPADLDIVADFNYRMAQETEGKELDAAVLRAGVEAGLADADKMTYYLAQEDGAVVGQMAVTREWSDWRNGWFWWVQSVYVRRQSRRQGVFRTLLRHVEQAARSTPSVIGIRLYVDHDNSNAQQVYLRLGFKQTGYLLLEKYPL